MFGLDNPVHLLVLLIVLLVVFGAKRLPEMGHSLGAGMRGFKEALSSETGPAGQPGNDREAVTTPGEPAPAPVSTGERSA